jgi:hypothetical protein
MAVTIEEILRERIMSGMLLEGRSRLRWPTLRGSRARSLFRPIPSSSVGRPT